MTRQPNGPATTPTPMPDDEPPEEWDEMAPADPKDPLPAEDVAEPGLPTKGPSPDTTPN